MGVLSDAGPEPLRISVVDAAGVEIASVWGRQTRLEEVRREGEVLAEFVLNRDGITVVIQLSVEPLVYCSLDRNGVITAQIRAEVGTIDQSRNGSDFEGARTVQGKPMAYGIPYQPSPKCYFLEGHGWRRAEGRKDGICRDWALRQPLGQSCF